MKRLINTVLQVRFGLELDEVESIRFKFVQSGRNKIFDYPSATAQRAAEGNIVNLIWSTEDTAFFEAGKPVLLDTFVRLVNSTQNPETKIVSLNFLPTLFVAQEVSYD